MNRLSNEATVVVKKDAIEDGVHRDIIDLLHSNPDVDVLSEHPIELSTEEVLDIYKHDLEIDPSERRRILITLAAIAMTGGNILLGVKVRGAEDQVSTFARLNQLKGKVIDDRNKGTIRGSFPYPVPDHFQTLDEMGKAPFFVRNRFHVPDTAESQQTVATIAASKGIDQGSIYARK